MWPAAGQQNLKYASLMLFVRSSYISSKYETEYVFVNTMPSATCWSHKRQKKKLDF